MSKHHMTAYQKAYRRIEEEGRKQCFLLYSATGLALWRYYGKKQGYRLQKIPDYDCSCYMPYPNERHKHKNGKWKCVDRYEPSEHKRKYDCYHMPCTYCNKRKTV